MAQAPPHELDFAWALSCNNRERSVGNASTRSFLMLATRLSVATNEPKADAKVYTTDTMHRVFLKPGTELEAFTASYYNSLSLAFAEVSGRSHGGGVLELMPNEAENILLPYGIKNAKLLSDIDDMLRKGTSIDSILDHTNKKILRQGYGFTDKEILMATSIWKKLSSRRLNLKQ